MRDCMTLYLKSYQKHDRSKLKSLNLLTKNFDHLRFRIIHYLIGKLSDMVKIDKESFIVAALKASVRAF